MPGRDWTRRIEAAVRRHNSTVHSRTGFAPNDVSADNANVVVIANGRLAAQGDFREIRSLMDDRPRRLRIVSDRPRSLASALVTAPHVSGLRLDGEVIEVETSDAADFARTIAKVAVDVNARLREVRGIDEDLETKRVLFLDSLVLDESKVPPERKLFYPRFYREYPVVSAELAKALSEAGITHLDVVPISECAC